jgi:hypothetical protein
MNDEKTTVENPIGLYRDPASGQFVGAIDPIQADAFVRTGFTLYKEGREAAMMSQETLDALVEGTSSSNDKQADSSTNKKGR